MGLIIGGIFGLLLAGGFYYGYSKNRSKALAVRSTPTSTAVSLSTSAQDVASEIGSGSFRQIAEIKGKTVSASPLRAELSHLNCVWYSFTVTREYEETYDTTDSEGRHSRQTRRGSEVVSSGGRGQSFQLQDSTGSITIDPEGAKIEGLKSHSSFQPGEPSQGLKIGNFLLNASGFLSGGRQTLGYRAEEFIIPLEKEIYVLGEASDLGGALAVRKPEDKKELFLISHKSEEQILGDAKGAETGFLIGTIVLGLAGIIALAYGIIVVLNP